MKAFVAITLILTMLAGTAGAAIPKRTAPRLKKAVPSARTLKLAPVFDDEDRFAMIEKSAYRRLSLTEWVSFHNFDKGMANDFHANYRATWDAREEIMQKYSLRRGIENERVAYAKNAALANWAFGRTTSSKLREVGNGIKEMPVPEMVIASPFTKASLLALILANKGRSTIGPGETQIETRNLLPPRLKIARYTWIEDINFNVYYSITEGGTPVDSVVADMNKRLYDFDLTGRRQHHVAGFDFAPTTSMSLGRHIPQVDVRSTLSHAFEANSTCLAARKPLMRGNTGNLDALASNTWNPGVQEGRLGIEYNHSF